MPNLEQVAEECTTFRVWGKVTKIVGLVVEGYCPTASVGTLCEVLPLNGQQPVAAEVVGFKDGMA